MNFSKQLIAIISALTCIHTLSFNVGSRLRNSKELCKILNNDPEIGVGFYERTFFFTSHSIFSFHYGD